MPHLISLNSNQLLKVVSYNPITQKSYYSRSFLARFINHYNLSLFIVTLYGVFTIHFSPNVPSRCLLLELLDVSVSELLLYSSQQGCSMWMIQHCARDVLEALAFLHREGYVHADLKPRNILWSAENECFKLIDFGLSFKEGNQVRNMFPPHPPTHPHQDRS